MSETESQALADTDKVEVELRSSGRKRVGGPFYGSIAARHGSHVSRPGRLGKRRASPEARTKFDTAIIDRNTYPKLTDKLCLRPLNNG
jgi:hypothetical protein